MVVSGRGKSLCCVALPHCETAGELFRYVQIERAFGNSISIEIGFASSINFGESPSISLVVGNEWFLPGCIAGASAAKYVPLDHCAEWWKRGNHGTHEKADNLDRSSRKGKETSCNGSVRKISGLFFKSSQPSF